MNTQENAIATVSIKIVGTFLRLLVPSMLVYIIWSLNLNKQCWEGKGKHGKAKRAFALSDATNFVQECSCLFTHPWRYL